MSTLGLGRRSWEVTLDEERGRLAWRDPRPPRRGGGEWSGGAGRAGAAGRALAHLPRPRSGPGPPEGLPLLSGGGRASAASRAACGRAASGMGAGGDGPPCCGSRSHGGSWARGTLRVRRCVGTGYFLYLGGFSPSKGRAAAGAGVQSPAVKDGGGFSPRGPGPRPGGAGR